MDTNSQEVTSGVLQEGLLPPNDYVSPGLVLVTPDSAFPNMVAGDTRVPQWLWLRKWVEHNWYTDRNHPSAGFASRDEAAILYNSALKFRGMPCLEIGCWRGWSAVHIALGAGALHVVDPILDNPEFAESIRASCAAAGVLDRIEFHAGFSPAAIDELSKSLRLRWSLVFIDADHEGDAPRLDAEAVMRNAADDAMVLFHDLASPFVAAGLDAMRNTGWRTMIYQTMQIMGVAWRGNVEPVRHIPDPQVFWTLPKHLSGYEVSGWKPPNLPRTDGAWWPGMSMEDRRNAAMMRAQETEDQLVVLINGHHRARTDMEAQFLAVKNSFSASQIEIAGLLLKLKTAETEALSLRYQYEELERRSRVINEGMQIEVNDLERRFNASETHALAMRAQYEESERHSGVLNAGLQAEITDLEHRLNASNMQALDMRAQYEELERRSMALNEAMQAERIEALNVKVYCQRVESAFSDLAERVRIRTARLKDYAAGLGRWESDLKDAIVFQAPHDLSLCALARWAATPRVLLGMLRRGMQRRDVIIRNRVSELGLTSIDVAAFTSWFARSRVLFGLIRRSSRSRDAIVTLELLTRTCRLGGQDPLKPDGKPLKSKLFDLTIELEHQSLACTWHRLRAEGRGSDNLGPYFAGIDFESDVVLAWVKHVSRTSSIPRSAEAINFSVIGLRNNPLFREAYYCVQAGIKAEEIDPATHYLLIGEALGIKPSADFDPRYYAARHIDVFQAGMGLLEHYTEHGHKEGRRPLPPTRRHLNYERFDNARQNVIIVLHETSRTGAPILGWNIAKFLSSKYNIFSILMNGGALSPEIHAISAETHGPFEHMDRHRTDLLYALAPLFEGRVFQYAIVNSSESRALIDICAEKLVPTLFLMHEFGAYVHPLPELANAFDWSDEIVFPAELVAASSEAVHPPLLNRTLRILPQGKSDLPTGSSPVTPLPESAFLALAEMKAAGVFFVLGAGSVTLRKGIDLFIAAAAAAVRADLNLVLHFVWIGHGYRPDNDLGYSVYLREQVERSGLQGKVTFLDEVSDLEAVYELADLFLLTSRLDPLPNVSIDAACRGIPVVCFQQASGTADILLRDPITSIGVVPHLDTQAAAAVVVKLATDEDLRRALSQATVNLARAVFNMEAYVQQLDSIGSSLAVAAAQWQSDADVISADFTFRQDFFLGAEVVLETRYQTVCRYIAQSNKSYRSLRWQRRPAPGFNPQLWHDSHNDAAGSGVNSFASFVRAGKPAGPWQLPVLQNRASEVIAEKSARALLHIVTDNSVCLVEVIERLRRNNVMVDLLVSTDSHLCPIISESLTQSLASAIVVHGRIDDIPSLMGYLEHNDTQARYQFVGHLSALSSTRFPNWQDFQWEHLLGGRHAMTDTILASFAEIPSLGLVFSAEPYFCDWDDRTLSRINDLASALEGNEPAVEHGYDFPDSGMFWARRSTFAALAALARKDDRNDNPVRPSAEDFERLLPLACRSIGADIGVTSVPGTGW